MRMIIDHFMIVHEMAKQVNSVNEVTGKGKHTITALIVFHPDMLIYIRQGIE